MSSVVRQAITDQPGFVYRVSFQQGPMDIFIAVYYTLAAQLVRLRDLPQRISQNTLEIIINHAQRLLTPQNQMFMNPLIQLLQYVINESGVQNIEILEQNLNNPQVYEGAISFIKTLIQPAETQNQLKVAQYNTMICNPKAYIQNILLRISELLHVHIKFLYYQNGQQVEDWITHNPNEIWFIMLLAQSQNGDIYTLETEKQIQILQYPQTQISPNEFPFYGHPTHTVLTQSQPFTQPSTQPFIYQANPVPINKQDHEIIENLLRQLCQTFNQVKGALFIPNKNDLIQISEQLKSVYPQVGNTANELIGILQSLNDSPDCGHVCDKQQKFEQCQQNHCTKCILETAQSQCGGQVTPQIIGSSQILCQHGNRLSFNAYQQCYRQVNGFSFSVEEKKQQEPIIPFIQQNLHQEQVRNSNPQSEYRLSQFDFPEFGINVNQNPNSSPIRQNPQMPNSSSPQYPSPSQVNQGNIYQHSPQQLPSQPIMSNQLQGKKCAYCEKIKEQDDYNFEGDKCDLCNQCRMYLYAHDKVLHCAECKVEYSDNQIELLHQLCQIDPQFSSLVPAEAYCAQGTQRCKRCNTQIKIEVMASCAHCQTRICRSCQQKNQRCECGGNYAIQQAVPNSPRYVQPPAASQPAQNQGFAEVCHNRQCVLEVGDLLPIECGHFFHAACITGDYLCSICGKQQLLLQSSKKLVNG